MSDIRKHYEHTDMQADLRWYLNGTIPGASTVIDRLSFSDLCDAIEARYEGGLAEFKRVFGTTDTKPIGNTNLDPQVALKRDFIEALGRKFAFAACHEVIRFDVTDNEIYLVIRVIDEEERGTRLIQRGAILRRYTFVHTGAYYQLDASATLEVTDPDWNGSTYVNSQIPVMDEERYTDKFWQFHECYRPGALGSDRNPLDGCYGPTRKDSRHDEYRKFIKTIRSAS